MYNDCSTGLLSGPLTLDRNTVEFSLNTDNCCLYERLCNERSSVDLSCHCVIQLCLLNRHCLGIVQLPRRFAATINWPPVDSLLGGQGILADVKGRLPWYGHDWSEGIRCGLRLLAPATYIFFASVIPALAFGQQVYMATEGHLSGVQVLIATAIMGVGQAVVGGQPLLIVGVAEPIVLIYSFMYAFAKGQSQLGPDLFLPWAAWVCIWTAAMIFALSSVSICRHVSRFTRLSEELFGFLIAVLFMQQAIAGTRSEFLPKQGPHGAARGPGGEQPWLLVNGLWALFLACGLTLSALLLRTAHAWRFGSALSRQLVTDYGAPLMVLAWSALSYALRGAPAGVPRRVDIPNTWQDTGPWSVARDLHRVPGAYIAAALLPALVITLLFFFDHSVSAQMAQQPEFNLAKPPAYHYDFALLSLMTLCCGCIGVPPVNGVLPQAPMHTKSLATLRMGMVRRALRKAAKGEERRGREEEEAARPASAAAVMEAMSEKSRALGSGAAELLQVRADAHRAAGMEGASESGAFNFERDIDTYIPVEVTEARLTGLLQSLLVAACLGLTPVLQLIPSAVLWGYFAFMALESLQGSQFWERLLYLLTDPAKRYRLLEQGHAPYIETLRFRAVAAFTAFQLAYLGVVWGITWIPSASFLFPLPIIALVPIRTHILPRVFSEDVLRELDAAAYEEAPPLSHGEAVHGGLDESVRSGSEERRRASERTFEEDEGEDLEREFTQGRAFQIRRHLSRGSIQLRARRSRSLDREEGAGTAAQPAPGEHGMTSLQHEQGGRAAGGQQADGIVQQSLTHEV